MAEARNCPTCGAIFNYIGLRDVCAKCYAVEEELYGVVFRFLRKRENRAATIERIVEVTGVTEEQLHRWVRSGRLKPASFPNLGYPCDKCGALTTTGKLCASCMGEIKQQLELHDAEQDAIALEQEKNRGTYFSQKKK